MMAKTKKMVKQVLMSIAALVSLTMALVEEFSRVTSIGGGFVEN